MEPADGEVIVVGAGPTGLMSAVLLARSGVRVRIFDKNPEQAHASEPLPGFLEEGTLQDRHAHPNPK